MTPDEVIDHVRNSIDGIEVDASPRETALALLCAGMTVAGVGLARLDEGERELQLEDLERNTRDLLKRGAEGARRRAAVRRWVQ